MLLLLRDAAKNYGTFEITEWFKDPNVIDAKTLRQFDAVVLSHVGANNSSPDFYGQTLPDYVKAGGGVFMVHSTALIYKMPETKGTLTAEEEKNLQSYGTPVFSDLLGAECMIAEGGKHVHPDRHGCSFPTKVMEPGNPLMAAFQAPAKSYKLPFFWFKGGLTPDYSARWSAECTPPERMIDEPYRWGRKSNSDHTAHVLLAVDKVRLAIEAAKEPNTCIGYPADEPDFGYSLIWMKNYGKGRVYYSTFGHFVAIFTLPCISRAYVDALQYVAGDLQVPQAPASVK